MMAGRGDLLVRRAVFLDRDGVINEAPFNPVEGKLDSPYAIEEFRLLPGVGESIRRLRTAGFVVVVVSNQPGVAKGKCDQALLDALSAHMLTGLRAAGGEPDGIYYCLHHPEAVVPELRMACDCRKPEPGLLLAAAQDWDIDLAASYMVGDSITDIAAGQACGCTTVLVGEPPVGWQAPAARHFQRRSLPDALEVFV